MWRVVTTPVPRAALSRGTDRARWLLRRVGDELLAARVGAGLSARQVGRFVGISHTQVRRIETGRAPHVDVAVLARMASVLGTELALAIHPSGSPVRDRGHLALLGRFQARIGRALRWRTEVPVPIPGDRRAADATVEAQAFAAVVEAETRLGDVQAVERRARSKARDLGADRVILLVADTRHNRAVIASTPGLVERFPVSTRACLRALARGEDPGGDCLVII
jgi:transcriptional regulator with XRE-family HTH domain